MSLTLEVDLRGMQQTDRELQEFRNALANRKPLHAKMAEHVAEFTRQYLRGLDRHKTADRLKAKPTGHHLKAAKRIQADSNDTQAVVRIPRSTGLGRAFGAVTIRPGGGKKFLTIPDHKETYGKTVRDDFPEGTFRFAIVGGRFPALVWTKTTATHLKGRVAFWLKKEVKQKQDRTLLPPDAEWVDVARKSGLAWISNRIYFRAA